MKTLKKYRINFLAILLIQLIILCVVSSCKRNANGPDSENKYADGQLPDNDLKLIENLETDGSVTLNSIQFDDLTSIKSFLEKHDPALVKRFMRTATATPLSFEEQHRLFIGRFLCNGLILANKAAHIYPEEGKDAPAQLGLAYSFGSKDHAVRNVPTMGSCNKSLKIYGLDCSGLIYQLAVASGLNIISDKNFCNVTYLKNPDNWNKALSENPDFDKTRIRVLDNVNFKDIRSGDIIAWGSGHIGIAGQGNILHSSGSANPGQNGVSDCEANFKKGPRISKITKGFMDAFNGGVYTVLRLEPKCSPEDPLAIHFNYIKTGAARYDGDGPYKYFLSISFSGGKAPYHYSAKGYGGGSSSSTVPVECNFSPLAYYSHVPFEPITITVRDSNGATAETVFVSY